MMKCPICKVNDIVNGKCIGCGATNAEWEIDHRAEGDVKMIDFVNPLRHSLRIDTEIQWNNLGLRIRTIMKHTGKKAKILVLGSGVGELPVLLKLYGYENVTTLDADKSVNADVLHDITKPFPFDDESFHIIIAFHVLEHVDFEESFPFALSEIYRVLNTWGKFYFAVPCRAWYFAAKIRFCRWENMSIGPYRILKKFTPNPTHFWEVSKTYPEELIRSIIERANFKIEEKIFTTVNSTELFLICTKVFVDSSVNL